MSEDNLLKLFADANVHIGKLEPHFIKAWFDTDCDNLLHWICTSITDDCYISAQQYSEYSQLQALPKEQLDKRMQNLQSQYPDILDIESNLLDIQFTNNSIEMLEEELAAYQHQLQINQKIHDTLSAELSAVSAEEIQSQSELESAQADCMNLSRDLDKLHCQIYDQVKKYGHYLSNYEFDVFPAFANNIDVSEFEDKLVRATSSLNSITSGNDDIFEVSFLKGVADTLTELQTRIFNTRISKIALQMEVEALRSTLKFLENYNTDTVSYFIDLHSVQASVGASRDEQLRMLKEVEETSLKWAEQCVNQPTLGCLNKELQFHQSQLSYVNRFRDCLMQILFNSVIMHILYFQEKNDIKSSSNFFRNINRYINIDIKCSSERTEAMKKIIHQFEEFCKKPIENKFKLVGDFGLLFSKGSKNLRAILESTNFVRTNTNNLRKRQFSCSISNKMFENWCGNIQVLRDFLISGPSSQMVTIPTPLQTAIFEVNRTMVKQNSCVKSLINITKNPTDISSMNKWRCNENLLWAYFMTDGTKMLSFLEQLNTMQSSKPNVFSV